MKKNIDVARAWRDEDYYVTSRRRSAPAWGITPPAWWPWWTKSSPRFPAVAGPSATTVCGLSYCN